MKDATSSRGDPGTFDPAAIPCPDYRVYRLGVYDSWQGGYEPKVPEYPEFARTGIQRSPSTTTVAPEPGWAARAIESLAKSLGRHPKRRPREGRHPEFVERQLAGAWGALAGYAYGSTLAKAANDLGAVTVDATALVASVRQRQIPMSGIERWLGRMQGSPLAANVCEPDTEQGIHLRPRAILPAALYSLAVRELMYGYALSLRATLAWPGERCRPAVAACAFEWWLGHAIRWPRLGAHGAGRAWGDGMASLTIAFRVVGDRELVQQSSAAARRLGPLASPGSDPDSPNALLEVVHAALWATLGAVDYVEGIRALETLGGDLPSTMAAAGTMLGIRFGREAIPAAWLAGYSDLSGLERELRAVDDVE